MPRLSRKLRIWKWICTVGFVLVAALLVYTVDQRLVYAMPLGGEATRGAGADVYAVWVALGEVGVWRETPNPVMRTGALLRQPALTKGVPPCPVCGRRDSTGQFHDDLFPIPFWPVGLALFGLACWLWWRDRRVPRPGFCRQCDYDLAGNVSGICPECGRPVATQAANTAREGEEALQG